MQGGTSTNRYVRLSIWFILRHPCFSTLPISCLHPLLLCNKKSSGFNVLIFVLFLFDGGFVCIECIACFAHVLSHTDIIHAITICLLVLFFLILLWRVHNLAEKTAAARCGVIQSVRLMLRTHCQDICRWLEVGLRYGLDTI